MVQPDFQMYHQSISQELIVLKDRIRNLIGNRHWQTDGEHKEAVLRKVLGNHVAESLRLSKGFVCYPDATSSKQLDILITDRNRPSLFKDGELTLVTPDAVKVIIEVKTKQNLTQLRETLGSLSEQVEKVRQYQPDCLAGLFVFEEDATNHNAILSAIHQHSQGQGERIIDWLSLGPKIFIRYWKQGTPLYNHYDDRDTVLHNSWYSYNLRDLGHAYFVSNVVWDTAANNTHEMQRLWFPIEGGKEQHRQARVGLEDGEVQDF